MLSNPSHRDEAESVRGQLKNSWGGKACIVSLATKLWDQVCCPYLLYHPKVIG